jgi:hypothetical protein
MHYILSYKTPFNYEIHILFQNYHRHKNPFSRRQCVRGPMFGDPCSIERSWSGLFGRRFEHKGTLKEVTAHSASNLRYKDSFTSRGIIMKLYRTAAPTEHKTKEMGEERGERGCSRLSSVTSERRLQKLSINVSHRTWLWQTQQ